MKDAVDLIYYTQTNAYQDIFLSSADFDTIVVEAVPLD